MSKTKVVLSAEEPESTEIIAASIIRLSEIGEQIKRSSLSQRAILVLLKDYTGLPQKDIKRILDALPELKRTYIK